MTSPRPVLTLALTLVLLAAPLAADAQPAARVAQVALLLSTEPRESTEGTFREELRARGWVVGQNLAIDARGAHGNIDRLRDHVTEVVRGAVDVLVVETTPGARAAARATTTIPIVFTHVSDPVGERLIASLAEPGGNVTGFTNILPELSGKVLELAREILPGLSRVGVLWNPDNPGKAADLRALESAAERLHVAVRPYPVRDPAGIEPAFAAMTREGLDAVITLADALTVAHAPRIAELGRRHRLPLVSNFTPNAEAGDLMTYAPDFSGLYRRAAVYVDRILRGASPAKLPVEQPTRFRLTLNLKTARALGLTIPPALLARADEIIE